MNFKEFCQPFYSTTKSECAIKGKTSQQAIVSFFLESALGENFAELTASPDEFGRWFRGTRNPENSVWDLVTHSFNEKLFVKQVAGKIKQDCLLNLFSEFGIKLADGEKPDKLFFAAALATQLLAIADDGGDAVNGMEEAYREAMTPTEFSEYLAKAEQEHLYIKTLLYTSEKRPIDDFYVCNTLRTEPYLFMRRSKSKDKIIKEATLEKLLAVDKCVMVAGMGGMGKSMMMRHLLIDAIRNHSKSGKLPIFVTLREYGEVHQDVYEMIMDSVQRYAESCTDADVHGFLKEGKCQILLDGLDEIKHSDLPTFERQLDRFMIRYPDNQYVMSTREFSSFVSLPRFRMLWIEPFSHEQSLELVDKLDFCSDEPKLREQFRTSLENEYFETHPEFVSNPLLLTIMLMSYSKHAGIPDKQHLFYAEAYQTLVRRHDNEEKMSYRRAFRSVKEPSEFTDVFREFCGKSYRVGDFKFTPKSYEEYYKKLISAKDLNQSIMNADNFLFDVCHSVCIMYEEGRTYSFLHRSFQEYLFADYYSRADDLTLTKLKDWIKKPEQSFFNDGNAFNMLYELDARKVERLIILPFLSEIFDIEEAKEYQRYLSKGYHCINYTIFNEEVKSKHKEFAEMMNRRRRMNEPSTVILWFVLKQLNIEPYYTITVGPEFDYPESRRFAYVLSSRHSGEDEVDELSLFRLPVSALEELGETPRSFLAEFDKDEDGKLKTYGAEYQVQFEKTEENPEKYSALIEVMSQETNPVRQGFYRVKEYYKKLKQHYDNLGREEDDNF